MVSQRCSCGAKYRFRKSSIGKRAKCKKCGTVFRLTGSEDDGTIPIANEAPVDDSQPARSLDAGIPILSTLRATKLCLDCGYILDHLPKNRCPECGRVFDPRDRSSFGPIESSGLKTGQVFQRLGRWLRLCIFASLAVGIAVVASLFIYDWKSGQLPEFAWFAGFAMLLFSGVFQLVFGVIVWIWSAREMGYVWAIASLVLWFVWIPMVVLAMREREAFWPLWWLAGLPVAIAGIVLIETSGVSIGPLW